MKRLWISKLENVYLQLSQKVYSKEIALNSFQRYSLSALLDFAAESLKQLVEEEKRKKFQNKMGEFNAKL